MDLSDSMLFQRSEHPVDAIETVVREYRDSDNVSLDRALGRAGRESFIDFDGGEPTLFTKDEQALDAPSPACGSVRSTTLSGTLEEPTHGLALGAVRLRSRSAMNPDAVGISTTVEFVTDGMPQSEDRAANTRRDILLLATMRCTSLRFGPMRSRSWSLRSAPGVLRSLPAMVLEGGGALCPVVEPGSP